MNGREIIKDIMGREGMSNAALANKLQVSQATLWDRIDAKPRNGKPRPDIPIALLSEMIQPMGYKVVVVPITASVPEEGYEIGERSGE